MTDVWCEDTYCKHNEIGRCTLDSIGLKLAPDGLSLLCAQTTDDDDDSIELPSIPLHEAMACDEHNGR